jgi:tRNA U34 2-thiouridine synthase MnmA/TrmU
MLAVRIMQEHGIEVEALNFKTIFTCCQDQAGQAAKDLGIRLTVWGAEDEYLDLVKYPKFGYGKGANPCVDCRVYMFQRARRFMDQVGAGFLISGEIVGQRPMSQKRRDLDVIAFHSRAEDILLRPLSAKLMPPTLPERAGWVDRERLYGIRGRSRKELIELGKRFGLQSIPAPSTGCALTDQRFARKVHDLINFDAESQRWDFEMLKLGRHFRFDGRSKVVVGRREAENARLEYLFRLPNARGTAMLYPANFAGPRAIVIGPAAPTALDFAMGLVLRYSKDYTDGNALLELEQDGRQQIVAGVLNERARSAVTVPGQD